LVFLDIILVSLKIPGNDLPGTLAWLDYPPLTHELSPPIKLTNMTQILIVSKKVLLKNGNQGTGQFLPSNICQDRHTPAAPSYRWRRRGVSKLELPWIKEKVPRKKVLIEFFRISCIFLSSQVSGVNQCACTYCFRLMSL
jgi:hypothetical protein